VIFVCLMGLRPKTYDREMMMLSVMKRVKLDKWYGTRVLGWELEESGIRYHFHDHGFRPIYPRDY